MSSTTLAGNGRAKCSTDPDTEQWCHALQFYCGQKLRHCACRESEVSVETASASGAILERSHCCVDNIRRVEDSVSSQAEIRSKSTNGSVQIRRWSVECNCKMWVRCEKCMLMKLGVIRAPGDCLEWDANLCSQRLACIVSTQPAEINMTMISSMDTM